ncbi:MAG: GNAT family N-acetyltransferase [Nanoarchaeota archaeon]|nr:GNAT family N-acetyltransferase [Nanoarchaeota archaeon]MBU1632485.1 GNAT family N-acetyltransferase [Nanoarchaeota archaeon]MBU1875995.1 GNAT family N-acetyltransferase [Nanoarchaeota archaeon]
MKIRTMQKNDLKTVYQLGKSIKELRFTEKIGFWRKKNLHKWVKSSNDILLVAEDKTQIIGFLLSMVHKHSKSAIIENLYVKKEYRKIGMGRNLVEECLSRLKKKGINDVWAEINQRNRNAINFFKTIGFIKGYTFVVVEKIID